jgi:hypothetical protein
MGFKFHAKHKAKLQSSLEKGGKKLFPQDGSPIKPKTTGPVMD